jgi:hypothetical protein
MEREMKHQPKNGIRISLQVPSQDPDLYENKVTDEIFLFLSRQRCGDSLKLLLSAYATYARGHVNSCL